MFNQPALSNCALVLIFSKDSSSKTVFPEAELTEQFKKAGSHLVVFVKSIFEGELTIATKNSEAKSLLKINSIFPCPSGIKVDLKLENVLVCKRKTCSDPHSKRYLNPSYSSYFSPANVFPFSELSN